MPKKRQIFGAVLTSWKVKEKLIEPCPTDTATILGWEHACQARPKLEAFEKSSSVHYEDLLSRNTYLRPT